jgi:hypothetical protein
MSKRTLSILVSAVAACAALLAFAAPGMARSPGDRNHDRIPDRWERAHHLSLKVNQAKRDQDRDGLRNRAEFLAGTDPRNDDSDDDGTKDGGEGAGTVTSFVAGVLTVHLFTGDDVKGTVDDQTQIECRHPASGQPTTRAASEGPGRDAQGDNDDQGEDHQGEDHQGEDGQGEDGHGDDDACDASALTAGAVVSEAELQAGSSGLVFREIKLVA